MVGPGLAQRFLSNLISITFPAGGTIFVYLRWSLFPQFDVPLIRPPTISGLPYGPSSFNLLEDITFGTGPTTAVVNPISDEMLANLYQWTPAPLISEFILNPDSLVVGTIDMTIVFGLNPAKIAKHTGHSTFHFDIDLPFQSVHDEVKGEISGVYSKSKTFPLDENHFPLFDTPVAIPGFEGDQNAIIRGDVDVSARRLTFTLTRGFPLS